VSEARYLVPALARGLDILALYSRERPSIGPAEMARALKLPLPALPPYFSSDGSGMSRA
jgi:hypothetical protein